MRISRHWRPADACRLLAATLCLCTISARPAAADVTGTVVDQSGRPVPRALVRVVDASGVQIAAGFADALGRFDLATSITECRVEASLTGFQPDTVRCTSSPSGALRLTLTVAPIEETLLVTATRTGAPASQVGASATVFTAADLERRQMPLMADLLMSTPGAMVVRSGAPGSLTSLFVRGGESDYNKVLLDGVPLNEPGGIFYFNNLTTENVDRVEIVRGAYSSLFGSDAMASVIQLFTRRGAREARRFSAHFEGGTYQTLRTSVAASGGSGRVDYSASAARLDSDNRVPNSGVDNTTLSGNVGIDLGSRAVVRVIARGESERVGTPGTTAFGRPDLDAVFERRDRILSLAVDDGSTGAFNQRAFYSLATSDQQSTNRVEDPPYTARFGTRVAAFGSRDFLNDSRSDLHRHHASYQADWRLAAAGRADHLLTLIADWSGERATLEDRLADTATSHSRDNVGAAAQHQILWPRLFLTFGGRVEHNRHFGTVGVPRASVVYIARQSAAPFGETHVRAGVGTGIKEPSMLESFSASPFFLGNRALKPERSRSVELGVDQRILGNRARLSLTYFDSRYSDIISLVTTDPATFAAQYLNVGVSRARGLEANVDVAPVDFVRARGGYTFLASKVVESASPDHPLFGLGQEAFRRPRHSGFAGVAVNWRRVTADLNGVFVGSFVDSDFGLFDPPLVRNPGHATWDARLAVGLTPRVTATLSIDNLTNRDFSEPFGYQPLRRAVRGGIRVTL